MRFKTSKFVDAIQYRGSVDPLRHFVKEFPEGAIIYDQGDWAVLGNTNYTTERIYKMDWLTRDKDGQYEIVSDAVFLLKYEPAADKEY